MFQLSTDPPPPNYYGPEPLPRTTMRSPDITLGPYKARPPSPPPSARHEFESTPQSSSLHEIGILKIKMRSGRVLKPYMKRPKRSPSMPRLRRVPKLRIPVSPKIKFRNMGEIIKIGDLVWAKMKGFSPWPAKVSKPVQNMKRPKSSKVLHCIFFFGSENFAWIEENNIKPYEEFKESLEKTCKTVPFKEACVAIADYKRKRDSGEIDEDAEDHPAFNDDDMQIEGESDSSPSRVDTAIINTPQDKPTISKTPNSTAAKLIVKRKKAATVENGEASSSSNRGTAPKKRRESADPKAPSKIKIRSAVAKRPTSPKMINNVTPVIRKSAATNLLDRPASLARPDTEPLNVQTISQTLKDKKITPSTLKLGFLGLGIMGSGMVKNLVNSGHNVMVWNRTPNKCVQFLDAGAQQGMTPSDVISGCDVTFACVSDPTAAKEMVFGNCGVLQEMDATKGYVEMTTTDSETSQDIAEAINSKGGRYLEAQVQGSKCEAEEGTLVILSAGDRTLYEECQSAFHAMGQNSFFLGEVGNASKMNLVIQLMMGSSLATLAEGMALADRAGLQQRDVLEILGLTRLACPLFLEKGQTIIDGAFPTMQPLQHMQKDLNLALSMGHSLEQPLPIAANANEIYKHAKRLGYGDHDAAAVYIRARF